MDRDAIPGKGKIKKVNQSTVYRLVKEKDFKNVIKPFTGSHVFRWLEFKLYKEVFNGNGQPSGCPGQTGQGSRISPWSPMWKRGVKKRHLDSIYVVEPGHFPGRRSDRRDYKVSIKNAPNQEVCTSRSWNELLL